MQVKSLFTLYSASHRQGKPVDFGSLPGDRNARRRSVAAFRRRLQQLTSKYENPSLKILYAHIEVLATFLLVHFLGLGVIARNPAERF